MKVELFFILLSNILLYKGCNKTIDNDEFLIWSENIKLNWKDFKGKSKDTSTVYAISVIQLKLKFNESRSGEKVKSFDFYATFDRNKSWFIDTSFRYILEHEQGHFDIGEICARKFRKSVMQLKNEKGSLKEKELMRIFKEHSSLLNEIQNQYDQETRFSRDVANQGNWSMKIIKQLDSLKAYSRK